jgi:hypothetical protein
MEFSIENDSHRHHLLFCSISAYSLPAHVKLARGNPARSILWALHIKVNTWRKWKL